MHSPSESQNGIHQAGSPYTTTMLLEQHTNNFSPSFLQHITSHHISGRNHLGLGPVPVGCRTEAVSVWFFFSNNLPVPPPDHCSSDSLLQPSATLENGIPRQREKSFQRKNVDDGNHSGPGHIFTNTHSIYFSYALGLWIELFTATSFSRRLWRPTDDWTSMMTVDCTYRLRRWYGACNGSFFRRKGPTFSSRLECI